MKPVITNLRTTALACASLIAATMFSTTALAQTTTPATLPSSFMGTYQLTYQSGSSSSPIANNTKLQLVLAPGGVMCVAGFNLTNPFQKAGNTVETFWTEPKSGISLAVASVNGNFHEINVMSGSTFVGQMTGSKISTATSCSGTPVTPVAPAAPVVDPVKVDQMFALAQQKLAQYFPSTGASTTQKNGDYTYRFYPGSNIYLAVNNGDIYVMGGAFGSQPIKQGPLETILSELTKMPVSIPPIPSGNSTLVVTGRVGTAGINVDIGSITLDNLPMPSGDDIDNVRKAVEDQYKTAGITGNIAVTLISSSSTQTIFNIKFNGVINQSGFTMTQNYDITYTYTKK